MEWARDGVAVFLESAALAFGLILLAEVGDKTQLVLITLALRGHKKALFMGAAGAFLVLTALAVVAADLIARVLPPFWLALIGAALFLAFGAVTLRQGITGEEEDEGEPPSVGPAAGRSAFLAAFGLIAVAEMGDKTQIAIAVLAANTGEPIAVGIGGWLALALLALLALLLGGLLARRLPQRTLRIIAGIVFIIVGIATLVFGAREAGVGLGTLL